MARTVGVVFGLSILFTMHHLQYSKIYSKILKGAERKKSVCAQIICNLAHCIYASCSVSVVRTSKGHFTSDQ